MSTFVNNYPKIVKITVDQNDADFVTNEEIIEDVEEEEFIRKVAEAISKFQSYLANVNGVEFRHHHNFPIIESQRKDLGEKSPFELYSDYLTQSEIEKFIDNFIPDCEFGLHTIESIELRPKTETEKLL